MSGRWWRGARPMARPVALLPCRLARYESVDPGDRLRTPVTDTVAASLEPLAWCLYRPFPARALTARDLLRFGLQGCQGIWRPCC